MSTAEPINDPHVSIVCQVATRRVPQSHHETGADVISEQLLAIFGVEDGDA
jgi:hypothetical protein